MAAPTTGATQVSGRACLSGLGSWSRRWFLLTSKCVSKMRISEKNWDHPDGCRSESPSALWIRFWGLFVRLHGKVFTTLHSWAFSNRDPEGGFGTSGANLKAPAPRYLQMPFECDESCRRDTWVEANEPIWPFASKENTIFFSWSTRIDEECQKLPLIDICDELMHEYQISTPWSFETSFSPTEISPCGCDSKAWLRDHRPAATPGGAVVACCGHMCFLLLGRTECTVMNFGGCSACFHGFSWEQCHILLHLHNLCERSGFARWTRREGGCQGRAGCEINATRGRKRDV